MIEISKPAQKTWYVVNIENPVCGHVETNQVFTCGRGTIDDLETFTVEQEWKDRLAELGVTIEEN